MDDLTRFFPIIPQNVPRDDFESYLRLYADEAGAFRASQRASGEVHAEWFVNTRVPVMRTLQGLVSFGIVGQPLGLDPTATQDVSGNPIVSATWVQRGLNAVHVGPLVVDGVAGPATQSALNQAYVALGGSPTGMAPQIVLRGTSLSHPGVVKISPRMSTYFANARQVEDPTPSSAPSAPSGTSSSTAPDATPFVQPVAAGIGQALGVLALLGLGAYALSRR